MKRSITACALTLAAITFVGQPVIAQDFIPRVALHESWSVFFRENPKECFTASAPTSWLARQSGRDVTSATRRGEIHMYITNRPSAGIREEIAFTGGYPFRDGSTVSIEIGGETFELFTEGEWAWPSSPEEDGKLIAAMKKGSTAIVRGLSSRGKTTIDTFDLVGVTAAMDEVAQRCS